MTTRIGQITLKVPKHRDGEPFKTFVFDNYCRSEAALIVTMAEMCVNGVSTRKVSQVMETLCGKSFSKSTVSEACKELDEKVKAFKERPLAEDYPFLTIDATYFKVREKDRVTSKALMIAYALNGQGQREIIGFDAYRNESKETWNAFLKDLKEDIDNPFYRVVFVILLIIIMLPNFFHMSNAYGGIKIDSKEPIKIKYSYCLYCDWIKKETDSVVLAPDEVRLDTHQYTVSSGRGGRSSVYTAHYISFKGFSVYLYEIPAVYYIRTCQKYERDMRIVYSAS